MNILLWILQILLAFHTATGAVWKFSNSAEQTMPSLSALPPSVWMVMAVVELFCAIALVVPALNRSLALVIPVAAVIIIAEMLVFSGLHLFSGTSNFGPMAYWLVVAVICAFIAYGRLVLQPL